MIREIHETLRTILMLAGVASREVIYEPLTVRTAEIRRARAGRRFPAAGCPYGGAQHRSPPGGTRR
jgi:hypothetical protein